jgi:hypothetical protein
MRFYAFRAQARGRLRAHRGYDAAHWQPLGAAAEVGVAAWTRRLLSHHSRSR